MGKQKEKQKQKNKTLPLTGLGGKTQMKAGKVNRKHYISHSHTAAVKCYTDSLNGYCFVTSDVPRPALLQPSTTEDKIANC